MKHVFVISAALLAGCAQLPSPDAGAPGADASESALTRPVKRPTEVAAPPANAVTVEQFDTTSNEERVAATEVTATGGEVALGRTVATLGNPAEAGFWLETPLVDTVSEGRVVSTATGESVAVELRSIGGPDGAGSRISLAALRLLNVGLAGLHELDVFRL
ncbi:D-galactarate dehydratase [Aliiroseovarius subalbicans]|uniref:D-galactarate dehydratase n=1 Tax=Aliiroseovarius subalbicans TaxID=2925840 RepID=UPI001F594E4B|nr:D-galactarate dehydratase [Aliiroseovarius subalbicans]MCI2398001.1 D-galactarate dehydratase [Aliiroseovarius subalbicans]